MNHSDSLTPTSGGVVAFRRPRFGLRRFLLLLTVFCIVFGWYYQHVNRNYRATEFLKREDISFRYFSDQFQREKPYPNIEAPNWQRRLLGDDYFLKIRTLAIGPKQAADATFWKRLERHRSALQDVESILLWCDGNSCADESATVLSRLPGLVSILVANHEVSSDWLTGCARMKNLRCIKIQSPSNTPLDVEALANLQQVSSIILADCGLGLADARFLRDQLRSTMVIVLENNDSNRYD